MTERIYRRPKGKRFLGDEAKMVVHDLENEDTVDTYGKHDHSI